MSMLSLAESYDLSSMVRGKLSREAADPKASLRSLVTQANMLDRILEHIEEENKKQTERILQNQKKSTVTFALPTHRRNSSLDIVADGGTLITEYEVDPASDDDDDFAIYSSESDSSEDESDFYSDSDEEFTYETVQVGSEAGSSPLYRKLPTISLSENVPLTIIREYDEDDQEEVVSSNAEVPELSGSLSSTDEEDFDLESDIADSLFDNSVGSHKIKRKPNADNIHSKLYVKQHSSSRLSRNQDFALEDIF